jgi:hypothetical protein
VLKEGSQINQAVISDLVKRHHGSGIVAVGQTASALPKGTYVGLVVDTQPHKDLWSRPGSRSLLEVTEGPHTGRQISVDARAGVAKFLEQAAGSRRPVRFDVFLRRLDGGRPFPQVNRETIRLADGGTTGNQAEPTPGLPAHVKAILASGNPRPCSGSGDGAAAVCSDESPAQAAGPPGGLAILLNTLVYTHGFACIGAKNAPRKLGSWTERYTSLMNCTDPSVAGKPVYLSLYAFKDELFSYMWNQEKRGSLAGYRGETYSPLIVFDIDRKDAMKKPDPSRAYRDTARLLVVLLELGIPVDCVYVSFSGSKGFHIEFPSMLAGAMPGTNFPETQKAFCSMIAAEAGIEIDTSIYSTLHSLRAPNSRHEESGLYKVPMTAEEFLDWDLSQIKTLAAKPRPLAPLSFNRDTINAVWELWRHSGQMTRDKMHRHQQNTPAVRGDARIWEATWQFLINGAPDGERAVATFKAASNLAHFESVDDLIRALLSRGVMLCGLPPGEAVGHIDSALRRAAEARLLGQVEFPPEP